MTQKIYSCSFSGLDCRIIEVEADIAQGLSFFSIVGLGDASVQESKDRVRASIVNSGATFPATRKTVNLAPAQIKKQGSLFDLPIAVSILLTTRQIEYNELENAVIIGELSLRGEIKPVNGVLPITHHSQKMGFKRIFLPDKNAFEASFIEGIEIVPLKYLKELIEICTRKRGITFAEKKSVERNKYSSTLFREIIGLEKAKRGISLSAAGGHNVLLTGSPGCGKTMLSRAIVSLLPEMTKEESLETTKIFSVAGLLDEGNCVITSRPFREVHHSSTMVSIVGGGGVSPRPGEISLAHNGVLFFDEISEFPRSVLEALRQPLEDKQIKILRAGFLTKFPCKFIFMGTSNPCPCGFLNDKQIQCKCRPSQISNYQKRLSGPLLDRFDIFLEVERNSMNKIFNKNQNNDLKEIREIIQRARQIQEKRFLDTRGINQNSQMGIKEIKQFCDLDKDCKNLMQKAVKKLNLSNRAFLKVLKLARTIADMEEDDKININHLSESLQFRKQI